MTSHHCKCGREWVLREEPTEVKYRGRIECVCTRIIVSWEGQLIYLVKEAKEPLLKEDQKIAASSST